MMVELCKNGFENPEETFLDEDPMTYYVEYLYIKIAYRNVSTTATLPKDSGQALST